MTIKLNKNFSTKLKNSDLSNARLNAGLSHNIDCYEMLYLTAVSQGSIAKWEWGLNEPPAHPRPHIWQPQHPMKTLREWFVLVPRIFQGDKSCSHSDSKFQIQYLHHFCLLKRLITFFCHRGIQTQWVSFLTTPFKITGSLAPIKWCIHTITLHTWLL